MSDAGKTYEGQASDVEFANVIDASKPVGSVR